MNSSKLAGTLAIFAAAALAQSPQTYTFVPGSLQAYLNPESSPCTAVNPAPQISGQSVTFTVNMQCTDTTPHFTAVGSVTLSFSSATVTGTVGTPSGAGSDKPLVLSTPLIMSASTSLTFTPANVNYSLGFLSVSGGVGQPNSFCYSNLPATNPENAAVTNCSLATLDIDPTTGNIIASVGLDIDYESFSGSPGYVVNIVFGSGSPSISALDVVQETTYDPVFLASKDVTLIADKPTMVRLWAVAPTPINNVTAALHGFRGTPLQELPDSPQYPWSGPLLMLSSMALPSVANFSGGLSQSLNFLLPADWIGAGDLRLTAELQPPPGISTDPAQISLTETVHFTTGAQSLSIAYIPFCYMDSTSCPSSDVAGYDWILRKLYPINPANVHYFRLFVPSSPWTTPISRSVNGFGAIHDDDGGFKAHLERIFGFSTNRSFAQLAGWLPALSTIGGWEGSSDPPFATNFGRGHVLMAFEVSTKAKPDVDAETLAHEVGHNLGLRHTNTGNCGDSDPFTSWPYSTPWSQEPGFDFVAQTLIPGDSGDLMSYCGDPYGISPFDVSQLLQNPLLAPVPVLTQSADLLPKRLKASAAAASSEQIIISGWAQSDGSAGDLDPFYRMPLDGSAPPSVAGGSHCLHFSGSAGALGDYCFDLTFRDVEATAQSPRQYFTLQAPLPAGATSVALMAGTQQLASLTATSAPPVLAITSPQQGSRWSGGMQTIAWTATDPDRQPMVFTVLYSSDGGQSWLPMALDISAFQFTFDPSQIMGGSNVFFRVYATDGMSSTFADVGPIQVVQTPMISVPGSLGFGTQPTGTVPIQTLTISNPGSGPLTVNSYLIDNPAFAVVSAPAPLAIGAGETGSLSVEWLPTAAGAQAGKLTLASTDPANPSVIVQLSGNAVAPDSGCLFDLSATEAPAEATGGPNTVTVTASMATCSWTAVSSVPWITITAGASGTGSGQVSYTVAPNTGASALSGALTIAGLTYTVTEAASAGQPGGQVLLVDGGTFAQAIGYPDGLTGVYFVNRLTPSTYPATLQSVEIYFGNRSDGLPQNAPITIVAGTASGSDIDGVKLAAVAGTVGTPGGFNSYTVSPVTINSGDFVVGFMVNNAVGVLPADEDIGSGSMQRSYTSATGGASFVLLDSVPGLGGNLGIRAVLAAGGTGQ